MERALGSIEDVDRFRSTLLTALKPLVPYDIASWNVVATETRAAQISAVDPTDCREEGDEAILGEYLRQNPLVAAADPTRVLKFSDFITRRELHRLELYDLVYRPRKVEHRSHSYCQRAGTMTLMHGALSALEHGAEAAEQAILVLDPGGRVQFATPAAAAALRDLPRADRPDQLPGAVDGFDAVVLERAAAFDGDGLCAAGLIRREARVLELVALGFTNAQIAFELGLSERTVAKHLEHIYGKSGVRKPTAAVTWARHPPVATHI